MLGNEVKVTRYLYLYSSTRTQYFVYVPGDSIWSLILLIVNECLKHWLEIACVDIL